MKNKYIRLLTALIFCNSAYSQSYICLKQGCDDLYEINIEKKRDNGIGKKNLAQNESLMALIENTKTENYYILDNNQFSYKVLEKDKINIIFKDLKNSEIFDCSKNQIVKSQ